MDAWPTIPYLDAHDFCAAVYTSDDHQRHDLIGWARTLFDQPKQLALVIRTLAEEIGHTGFEPFGGRILSDENLVIEFNDSQEFAIVARVWRIAMVRLGYDVEVELVKADDLRPALPPREVESEFLSGRCVEVTRDQRHKKRLKRKVIQTSGGLIAHRYMQIRKLGEPFQLAYRG